MQSPLLRTQLRRLFGQFRLSPADHSTTAEAPKNNAEFTDASNLQTFNILNRAMSSTEIPVVIPTFNNVTYCKNMIEQLRERGALEIIVFDNASTHKPMRKFLASPPKHVSVFAGAENLGPFHAIMNPMCLALLPNYFCVTDPDLEFGSDMPNSFLRELAQLTHRFKVGKAGLALDISDRELMHQKEFPMATGPFTIWDWEKQFWKKSVGTTTGGDPIYRAPIDTTLAVYNKLYYRPKKYWDAVRVAGRYTCKHLPWYKSNGLPAEEETYYRSRATRSYYLSDQVPIADANR
ncbi:MAG: glycosyltransferase family A protein [Aestuariivirga sp.]